MAIKKKSIESEFEELEQILSQISSSDTPLEEAIELYAKAAKLLDSTHNQLKTAEVKITEISENIQRIGAEDEL